MAVRRISMVEMKSLLEQNPVHQLLDVRTAEEFATGYLKGSLNISHEDVPQNLGRIEKDKSVFVYCRSGRRAEMVCDFLRRQGYEHLFCIVNSGMEDWIQAGFSYEKSGGNK